MFSLLVCICIKFRFSEFTFKANVTQKPNNFKNIQPIFSYCFPNGDLSRILYFYKEASLIYYLLWKLPSLMLILPHVHGKNETELQNHEMKKPIQTMKFHPLPSERIPTKTLLTNLFYLFIKWQSRFCLNIYNKCKCITS